MLTLIKHEFSENSFVAVLVMLLGIVACAIIFLFSAFYFSEFGDSPFSLPMPMIKVFYWSMPFLPLIFGVMGAHQMNYDRSNKISTFLSTLAVTRQRIFAARITAGLILILVGLVPFIIACAILLALFPQPVPGLNVLLAKMFFVAFLADLAGYALGLLLGWHNQKSIPFIGVFVITAILIGLVTIKGFSLQCCVILVLIIAAALVRAWQKFLSASL